ncbi:Solute carrier organic anion transporter family member [Fasciola hepatica]|uniref:Solute carrier organic anion transporter family member n=1 Tax=Fasciola hepatica TaxID=6192 RepID=A0A4E0RIW2_FASHE|nr:Solute carrier organic anion transporter family member [Fasciola hepatica]
MSNAQKASTSAEYENPVHTGTPNQNVTFSLKDPDSPCGTFFPSHNMVIESDKRLQCGLLTWRPRCLKDAGNIKAFLAAACFISCLQAAYSGYAASQMLIGGGSSPILTLAPPFIDDHVHPTKAPPMIASQYAAAAMGPVLGFALGALVLQYPADLFVLPALKPTDPEWIGAWWVGFIFLGMLVFIGAIILLLFPRKLIGLSDSPLKKLSSRQSAPVLQENGSATFGRTPVQSRIDSGRTLHSSSEPTLSIPDPWSCSSRTFPRSRRSNYSCAPHLRCRIFESPENWSKFSSALRSIVRNKIYLVVCMCICSEMFMIIGFASFLPKYLEMEYHISKSATSAIAGGLIVPSGALGILIGGLILHRFRFHRRAAIQFVLFVNLIILGCITSFFFLGCHNPPIAGVTRGYPNQENRTVWPSIDLTVSQCNQNCRCDRNAWFPVCHSPSGISFISPCFAGCTKRSTGLDPFERAFFEDCSCLPMLTGNNTHEWGRVVHDQCPLQCNTIVLFVIVLTTCLFLTGVIQNPLLMVTMRSVNHSERSFALGLQFVIIRLLANMPSPIVFGRVIDEACRYWRYESGRRGDCAFVDVRKLNNYMAGLGVAIKGTGFLFYLLLLYLLRSSSGTQAVNELGLGPPPILHKTDASPDSSAAPSNPPQMV